MKMTFGDWELFRMVVETLKDQELNSNQDEGYRSVRFIVEPEEQSKKGKTF